MSYIATNLPPEKHCFFGSQGGVSSGKYKSLNTNLSSQDDRNAMLRNFAIIAEYFNKKPQNMFTMRQSVTNIAVYADKPSWFQIAADGAVTTNPEILLGIKTADCAPVLLADYQHGVIGAAHAGWRGACRGIVENVVKLMLEKGAQKKDIVAAVGPCLQQQSFCCHADMAQVFLQESPLNEQYFQINNEEGNMYFDLSGYLGDKLVNMGIENVENSHIDTYPFVNGYFSYRRQIHANLVTAERDYPTQYSCICL